MTFPNPPIVEAIFHLLVERESVSEDRALKDYVDYITGNFPLFVLQEERCFAGNISFDLDNLDNTECLFYRWR
jgi:hypothetical protein